MVEIEKLKEKLREIVQEYLRRSEALKKERDQKLCAISCDDPLLELEIHDEYLELENVLWEEYAKKLEKMLDEVDLEEVGDNIIRVGRKIAGNKQYVYYYDISSASLDVYEMPLITPETTPFTCRVVASIPWGCIRPIWYPNVKTIIYEMAEAELTGELNNKINQIISRLEAGSWVYEYRHLLNAIEKAIAETSKQ